MKIIIKTMETPEEIEGKSLVHWETWREAYDDILPAEFQETMTLEKCRFFSQKYPENTLIAMDGKKVVGFISYGNFREEAIQAGEIIALYVLKDYYEGKGLTISVKIKAILFLSCGMGFSVYRVHNLHLRIMLVLIWAGVALHIILLKTKPKEK